MASWCHSPRLNGDVRHQQADDQPEPAKWQLPADNMGLTL
jgi:hypothetical protein